MKYFPDYGIKVLPSFFKFLFIIILRQNLPNECGEYFGSGLNYYDYQESIRSKEEKDYGGMQHPNSLRLVTIIGFLYHYLQLKPSARTSNSTEILLRMHYLQNGS